MSLIKQLWFSIILLMLTAFSGSFIISMVSGKNYLATELQNKNIDNANSLALSMSQIEKNPVNIELLVSAQFDAGHYQLVRVSDPLGKIIVERKNEANSTNVPAWFIKLVEIKTIPGYAQVQDGWQQYGTVRVESNPRFAYQDLWRGSQMLLLVSLILSCISGVIGTLILRRILKPLDSIIKQAEALGERRFIRNIEPKTTEFKVLVRAMNGLSERIRKVLEDEAQRLEKLRKDANYDAISKLMNREYFFSRANAYMRNEESFSEGVLVVSRIANLIDIDKAVGHENTDAMLSRLGAALEHLTTDNPNLLVGRLAAKDFAVFSGDNVSAFNFASKVNGALMKAANLSAPAPEIQLTTVSSQIKRDDTVSSLYANIQGIIADLVMGRTGALHVIGESEIDAHHDNNADEWRKILTHALDAKRVKLAHYPVISTEGKIIHQESPVRLKLNDSDDWVSAGEFISWASRLDLVSRIDFMVLELALDALSNTEGDDIGLNISSSAICNTQFVQQMAALIAQKPEAAKHLWLEVPERGAFENLPAFREFCNIIKPLGCKIGLEHVGAYISQLGELHDLGLDYIKIDVSVISGIDKNIANQTFLRGLCLIAHSIGLMTIAEGVQNSEEIAYLPTLGIDGMTGAAVKATLDN